MIHLVDRYELNALPDLAHSMFTHRAQQFHDRLKWDVKVDRNGYEKDEYDQSNPIYLMIEQDDGSLGGSMRFLPTTDGTMLNQHFDYLTGGRKISNPRIWECTRFCIAPNSNPLIARQLAVGVMEMGLKLGLTSIVGVFEKPMLRVYRKMGWTPRVFGEATRDSKITCVGLWQISEEVYGALRMHDTIEPPPLKWSAPIVRKAEDERWRLRDPSRRRLS